MEVPLTSSYHAAAWYDLWFWLRSKRTKKSVLDDGCMAGWVIGDGKKGIRGKREGKISICPTRQTAACEKLLSLRPRMYYNLQLYYIMPWFMCKCNK